MMAFEITLGTWLIPLAVTILCLAIAYREEPKHEAGVAGAAGGMIGLFQYAVAIGLSLLAWLVWALLK